MSDPKYRPYNAATDGVFGRNRPFCMATDGYLCRVGRPRGGGRRKYFSDDVDLEKLKERVRRLRDARDLADLQTLVRILAKVLR